MNGGGNLPVGPGIWGFIAFFVLAIALWFLVRNMNSRLRRMAYRDRDRAEELAATGDVDGHAAGSGTTPEVSDAPREPGDDAPGERPRP
ncbi:hypothetical protein GCM10009868_19340 [Terrabacter aerolatus]|uniref:Uncharacterized protein n=1 Tax=Terrabacter aerolatus TaxID=422442 RepID=A0A512D016_9MICO|nr:hypothetical protein [Terrabacter aerolatus]GEO29805.1 hypothetical protein TAE01_16150 [Terrabacter aerolatus]